jgi:prepilin-type N-terminal cleavage/methylation domain-containing protein
VVGRRAPEKGMTLVELMVTMIIASIVAASTFMFFAGQQRVYETQTKMLNVQQNVWASMEVLSRFVRSQGSGMYGCVRPVGGLVASPPLNRSLGADPGDDPPVVAGVRDFSQRPTAGLRAYNAATGQVQRIPPLWIVDQVDPNQPSTAGIVGGTDVITVAFGNRSSGTNFDSQLLAAVTNASYAIAPFLPANLAMFQPGEFIVLVGTPPMGTIVSDIGCTLFQITTVTATLNHASGGTSACLPPPATGCTSSVWNPPTTGGTLVPSNYDPNSPTAGIRNFGEFWWVRFAIRTKTQAGVALTTLGIPGVTHDVPVLTMERLDGSPTTGPQVLAEGIEDLQVAYACDLNADGVLTEDPNSPATDEWMLNSAADVIATSTALKCNQPSAVRLTLVARSLTEDNGIDATLTDNGRPAVENRPGHTLDNNFTTGRDQFRRRVLTTTVYPRNN